ncbi:MAG: sulfotransferase [bacterium]
MNENTIHKSRKIEYRKNKNLEHLICEINHLLGSANEELVERFCGTKHPVILVVGAPRSGTTLLLQWLSSMPELCYPTNLLSRFYGAPLIGAKIQQLLTDPDYSYGDELSDIARSTHFVSNLGKTTGALEPNEFWYFWRRFFKYEVPQYFNPKEISKDLIDQFNIELNSLMKIFGKPIVMKGMHVQYNLDFINKTMDNVLFVHIERDLVQNINSLIKARLKYSGDINEWYSVIPTNYDSIKDLDPYCQVAGQVINTNEVIGSALEKIDNKVCIKYEQFCRNPLILLDKIESKIQKMGYKLEMNRNNKIKFTPENHDISEKEMQKIHHSIEYYCI